MFSGMIFLSRGVTIARVNIATKKKGPVRAPSSELDVLVGFAVNAGSRLLGCGDLADPHHDDEDREGQEQIEDGRKVHGVSFQGCHYRPCDLREKG